MNVQMIKAALEFKHEAVATAGKFKGQLRTFKLVMNNGSETNKAHFGNMKDMSVVEAIEYAKNVKDPASLEADIKQAVINQFRVEVKFNSINEYETAKVTRTLGDKWSTTSGWSAYEYMPVPENFNI